MEQIIHRLTWCILGLATAALLPAGAAEIASAAAAPVSGEATAAMSAEVTVLNGGSASELDAIVVTAQRLKLSQDNKELDEARDRDLLPKLGATAFDIDQAAIDTLPQGKNTPLDKVLLQAPGVSYDSAISNPDFHVRNEYANVQYRINGIQLPDGVSALGPVLGSGFVGNLNLLDGTLPAQYGLRTAGVVDITAKAQFDPAGNVDIYGGSWGTISPSVEYGGSSGGTQYFMSARYLENGQGLESATPTPNPIHDRTEQERLFGYGSTLFGDSSRLTYLGGLWIGRFQIPDVAGQEPLGDFGSSTLPSTSLNENEKDRFYFGVVALQTKHENIDTQLSVFTRYASTDFVPDAYGDLAFNDVAANVVRKSLLSGLEFDAADRFSDAHTLRGGLTFSIEHTQLDDLATVLPLDSAGDPYLPPETLNDHTSKLGWVAGGYVQDEWRMRPDLTLNTGLRFDQMNQFVSAHQVSPRIVLVYKPFEDTSLHAGVSRYFTPPMQAQATPNNLALFQNTTQEQTICPIAPPASGCAVADPVRPERATYYDVGVDQRLSAGFSVGADVYYKRVTDALDDGQFGQAVVLEQFNYARGFSRGAEFKLSYTLGGLRAYANVSHEVTMAKDVNSNQYLIGDPVELAYLATRYTPTSDSQTITGSTGVSYRWSGMLVSVDGIYGSGLRAGFANLEHTPQYTQWNAAIARDFDPWHDDQKPLSLRLSAINLFDRIYLLRSGTGIGEFAPQYGPRRGAFIELTQQF
jgi:outer membrane receptor protein involved in Fe transport